jgi:two-component system response regulator RegA
MSTRDLLLIDPIELDRESIACELRRFSAVRVTTAASLEEIPSTRVSPDALVLSASANDWIESIARTRDRFPPSTILIVGYVPAVWAFEAARAGADALLLKPVTAAMIVTAIDRHQSTVAAQAVVPSLARAEWEYLHAILASCRGNRSEAARRLGIHRSVLQRKLSRNPPAR